MRVVTALAVSEKVRGCPHSRKSSLCWIVQKSSMVLSKVRALTVLKVFTLLHTQRRKLTESNSVVVHRLLREQESQCDADEECYGRIG